MRCPVDGCDGEAVKTKDPNEGTLYVVSDDGGCAEYFAGVDFYKCSEGHWFFVGTGPEKGD